MFKRKKPVTHTCHAGLLDTAIPIIFKDNNILGYIMFGQAIDEKKNQEATDLIKKLVKNIILMKKN